MTIETALYPNQLNATLPPQSDIVREGAGHLRLLKTVVKTTFPNLGGAWNATQTEANYIVGVTSPIQAQFAAKFDKTGGDVGGNINFTGTARRITGDFSNGALANRVMFQTSTSNAVTSVSAIPNGAGNSSNFSAYAAQDPANSSRAQMSVVAGVSVNLSSNATGTGSYLPLVTDVNGVKQSEYPVAGGFLVTNGSLGYGIGAGGSATQGTTDPRGKGTPVTLNKPNGVITLHPASLAAGGIATFALSNTFISNVDTLALSFVGSVASVQSSYSLHASTGAGAAFITIRNESTVLLSEAVQFTFKVIHGSIT